MLPAVQCSQLPEDVLNDSSKTRLDVELPVCSWPSKVPVLLLWRLWETLGTLAFLLVRVLSAWGKCSAAGPTSCNQKPCAQRNPCGKEAEEFVCPVAQALCYQARAGSSVLRLLQLC